MHKNTFIISGGEGASALSCPRLRAPMILLYQLILAEGELLA